MLLLSAFIAYLHYLYWKTLKEVASITLRNAHKENKRAKSGCSFAHLLFFVFELWLGFGLDFEFGLGLTLGLDLGLEFGLGLGFGLGLKLRFSYSYVT